MARLELFVCWATKSWKTLVILSQFREKGIVVNCTERPWRIKPRTSELRGWWCCVLRQIFFSFGELTRKNWFVAHLYGKKNPCSWSSKLLRWVISLQHRPKRRRRFFFHIKMSGLGVFQMSRALDYPCWFVWEKPRWNNDGKDWFRTISSSPGMWCRKFSHHFRFMILFSSDHIFIQMGELCEIFGSFFWLL